MEVLRTIISSLYVSSLFEGDTDYGRVSIDLDCGKIAGRLPNGFEYITAMCKNCLKYFFICAARFSAELNSNELQFVCATQVNSYRPPQRNLDSMRDDCRKFIFSCVVYFSTELHFSIFCGVHTDRHGHVLRLARGLYPAGAHKQNEDKLSNELGPQSKDNFLTTR